MNYCIYFCGVEGFNKQNKTNRKNQTLNKNQKQAGQSKQPFVRLFIFIPIISPDA